jgi:hypothetical protein
MRGIEGQGLLEMAERVCVAVVGIGENSLGYVDVGLRASAWAMTGQSPIRSTMPSAMIQRLKEWAERTEQGAIILIEP